MSGRRDLATEADLQGVLVDAARIGGWRVAHFRPARTTHGWRTPAQYDAAGFPDLVMARPGQLAAWELKSSSGRVSVDQCEWLRVLRLVPGVDVRVVRPVNVDEAVAFLLAKPAKPAK